MEKKAQKCSYSLFQLPEEVENMTIGQLIRESDELYSKNGESNVKKKINKANINLQINFFNGENSEDNFNEELKSSIDTKNNYWDEISVMLEKNMKQKEIAEKLGVTPSYVSQIIKKNR